MGGEEIVRIITIGATVAFTCVLRGAVLKKGRGDVRRGKIATANRYGMEQICLNCSLKKKKQSSGEQIVRELRQEE